MRYILRVCIVRENTEAYVDELIKACKYANIDEIMMCEDNVFITATPQPLTAHKEMAEIMKRAVEKCKANGIQCSFYVKSLVGHFSSNLFALPYTKFVGANNEESLNEMCILDDGFADYAAELTSYYAECGFDSMMLDDDFRSINHCNGKFGCFCDLHVKRTAQRYGKELTREQLIKAFKSHDSESAKIKKCHREINFEGQLACAKKIEQAIHAVDDSVQIGLMASGLVADQYQGRDIQKLLQTLAGEGRTPFIRPPGGTYSDVHGADLFECFDQGISYRSALGNKIRYASEIDVFSPRNIFRKSVKILDLQCCLHALSGYEEFTLNLIDHYGTSPMESIEYLDMLKDNKEKYDSLSKLAQSKSVCGIGVPLPNNYVEKLDENPLGSMWRNNDAMHQLHRLGLPISCLESDVNYLTGEALNCYSDEQFLALLSKGLILDEQATKIAIERGFKDYLGASFVASANEPCFEVLTDADENGTYADFRFPAYTGNIHTPERVYCLKALNGATVLSELVNSKREKIGDCCIYYENSLGGRVLVMGTRFIGNNLYYKGRRKQLHEIVKKLFKGALPFDILDAISIAPIWYKGENSENVLLYNFGLDEQVFTIEQKDRSIQVRMMPLSIKNLELGE